MVACGSSSGSAVRRARRSLCVRSCPSLGLVLHLRFRVALEGPCWTWEPVLDLGARVGLGSPCWTWEYECIAMGSNDKVLCADVYLPVAWCVSFFGSMRIAP